MHIETSHTVEVWMPICRNTEDDFSYSFGTIKGYYHHFFMSIAIGNGNLLPVSPMIKFLCRGAKLRKGPPQL